MALFSSVLTSYSTKVNGQVIDASDVNNLQTDVQQIEAILGVDGASSVVGTYAYLVKSPASNGGGHVQTAITGGTGQTSFNKGDILIAQSNSVLSKLAVGNDNQILTANSSVATGVSWINNVTPKISASASVITNATTTPTSILVVTVPGSTLGINNAIRATAYVTDWEARGSVIAYGTYGGGVVASIAFSPPGAEGAAYDNAPLQGKIEFTLIANNSSVLQRGFLNMNVEGGQGTNSSVFGMGANGTSSVASSSNQIIGIMITDKGGRKFDTGGTIVERLT